MTIRFSQIDQIDGLESNFYTTGWLVIDRIRHGVSLQIKAEGVVIEIDLICSIKDSDPFVPLRFAEPMQSIGLGLYDGKLNKPVGEVMTGLVAWLNGFGTNPPWWLVSYNIAQMESA